jgi:hypothetical protein
MFKQAKHTKQTPSFEGSYCSTLYNFCSWKVLYKNNREKIESYNIPDISSELWTNYVNAPSLKVTFQWAVRAQQLGRCTPAVTSAHRLPTHPAHSTSLSTSASSRFQINKSFCAERNPTHIILSKQTELNTIKNKAFTVSWHLKKKATLPKTFFFSFLLSSFFSLFHPLPSCSCICCWFHGAVTLYSVKYYHSWTRQDLTESSRGLTEIMPQNWERVRRTTVRVL